MKLVKNDNEGFVVRGPTGHAHQLVIFRGPHSVSVKCPKVVYLNPKQCDLLADWLRNVAGVKR